MNAWEERWSGLSDDAKLAIAAGFKRQAEELRDLLGVALSGVCHRITPEELKSILGGDIDDRARLLLENRLLSQSRNDTVAINDRLREENDRLHKQMAEDRQREYGYSQETVNALTKERDKLQQDVDRLRKLPCKKFRVTDGARIGTCYSLYNYFDVWWDSGSYHLGVADLSVYGIRKVEEPPCPPSS